FDVEALSLEDQDIPEGLTALVIADPRAAFTPEVLEKINRYIDQGGNILLAGEPGKQAILNPILERLGVQLMDGTIVQGNVDFSPDEVKSLVTTLGSEFGRTVARLHTQEMPISTRNVAGLTYTKDGDF